MTVTYQNEKIRKICTDALAAEKKYGTEMAVKIQLRIDQIAAAPNVEIMVQKHIGRCYALDGNRKGQFAVDLVHPQRLVFESCGEEVHIANILEIVDYH